MRWTLGWSVLLYVLLSGALGVGQTRRRHRVRHRGADAPTGAAEAPDLEPYAVSAMRYLVSGVLKGLWSELARVLLTTRPPVELEQPFPRVAMHVGRAELTGVPVWMAERLVRDRPGFAVYCRTHEVEVLDAWLIERGLGDEMLV